MDWRDVVKPELLLRVVRRLRVQFPATSQSLQVPARNTSGRFRRTARKKLIDLLQQAPDTVILAEDEATLYLQATTQQVWAPCGLTPIVRSDPSHRKTNFFGTLNLHNGDVIATREPVMDAEASAPPTNRPRCFSQPPHLVAMGPCPLAPWPGTPRAVGCPSAPGTYAVSSGCARSQSTRTRLESRPPSCESQPHLFSLG
jgi:hypothetical protein